MLTRLLRTSVSALLTGALLWGCGGGDTGPAGPAGPKGDPGPVGPAFAISIPSNATPATDDAAAAWAALEPQVTVTSVTINSAPVVQFSVQDAVTGFPILGLGNRTKSSTATVAGLPNLAFSLAKLIPASNGSPSRWVSYIVTGVPSTSTAKDANGNFVVVAQRPGTDNTGELVDHGNGNYTYTFWRDPTAAKTQLATVTMSDNDKRALGGDTTFADLTYDVNATHRLTIQVSGNAPGTGTNTPNASEVAGFPPVPLVKPLDVIHDFVPATGPVAQSGREIVAVAKCNECHRKLGGIPGDSAESSAAGFHGGARNETRYCVMCHTEQRKFGRTEATINATTLTFASSTNLVDGRAVGNLPNHIHKTHMGKHLAKKNYNYGGVLYNEIAFPQDLRNCTKCHDGTGFGTPQAAPNATAQGDNWKNVPNRLACGGCHDGINFAIGAGVTIADAAKGLTSTTSFGGLAHGGGAVADDTTCSTSTCHTSQKIDIAHTPITPPSLQSALHVQGGSGNSNSAWIASNTNRLPAGAVKVSYDIKSVSRGATTKRPVMVFRMLQNGARKDLNVYDTTAPNPVTGRREIWENFMGAPSVYFVFAVPQDSTTAPADFNGSVSAYLRCLWNGTATAPDPDSCTSGGTLTGPDADGYYTAMLTAPIPDNAVMLTGGLGYSYSLINTMPLTQTNLAAFPAERVTTITGLTAGMPNSKGGLVVVAPNAQRVATGYVGRRAIVEDRRCNACHQELGTFTEEAFHGGQRNDGTTCAWCHTPNRTSSGWSADSTSFIHAIHGGAKRTVDFNWHAISATEGFWKIGFPGVLKECETCHVPGTSDFSASASAAAMGNRLFRTVATGTPAASISLSPYVTVGNPYGSGFSFNTNTGVTTPAAATTLVTSPIATQCFSCHDSVLARTHMEINGASIYAPRSTALAAPPETCMVCHGNGRIADIRLMHRK